MESNVSTANAVWIAIATLHKENSERDAFQVKEIVSKIKELDIQNASDATVSTHISSHCVADKPAQPDTHTKLYRLRQGWYRLHVSGDPVHITRIKGQSEPLPEMIPEKFRKLIIWYRDVYDKQEHERGDIHPTRPLDKVIKKLDEKIEFASINTNNTIQIPDKIINALKLETGDHIGFIQSGDQVILKKAKVRLEV
jgi:hypothetical protein